MDPNAATSVPPATEIAFLSSLRAVRRFRSDPVPPPVVDDLLRVARWSGSARNRQPWEFVVVRDRETLRALAAAEGYAGHLADAPLGLVLVMAGEERTQETFDEGRLSERIMLAALAHGVGSCLGWFTLAGAETAKATLGVPAPRSVRTALSLGYPDRAAAPARGKTPRARKPLAELVHEERYRA